MKSVSVAALLLALCAFRAAADEPASFTVSEPWRAAKPFASLLGSSDGVGYARSGLYRDFALAPRWTLTPHASLAGQSQVGVDLMRRLDNGWSAGLTFRNAAGLQVAVPLR